MHDSLNLIRYPYTLYIQEIYLRPVVQYLVSNSMRSDNAVLAGVLVGTVVAIFLVACCLAKIVQVQSNERHAGRAGVGSRGSRGGGTGPVDGSSGGHGGQGGSQVGGDNGGSEGPGRGPDGNTGGRSGPASGIYGGPGGRGRGSPDSKNSWRTHDAGGAARTSREHGGRQTGRGAKVSRGRLRRDIVSTIPMETPERNGEGPHDVELEHQPPKSRSNIKRNVHFEDDIDNATGTGPASRAGGSLSPDLGSNSTALILYTGPTDSTEEPQPPIEGHDFVVSIGGNIYFASNIPSTMEQDRFAERFESMRGVSR